MPHFSNHSLGNDYICHAVITQHVNLRMLQILKLTPTDIQTSFKHTIGSCPLTFLACIHFMYTPSSLLTHTHYRDTEGKSCIITNLHGLLAAPVM